MYLLTLMKSGCRNGVIGHWLALLQFRKWQLWYQTHAMGGVGW
jgi:hypothetical protein